MYGHAAFKRAVRLLLVIKLAQTYQKYNIIKQVYNNSSAELIFRKYTFKIMFCISSFGSAIALWKICLIASWSNFISSAQSEWDNSEVEVNVIKDFIVANRTWVALCDKNNQSRGNTWRIGSFLN